MAHETYTCPRCMKTSHNPNDARHRWCGACNRFESEVGPPPVFLSSAIGEIMRRTRRFLESGSPFSLQFEMFTGSDGVLKWRALVKIGQSVWKHSRREHESPEQALLELVHSWEDPYEQFSRPEPGMDRHG